MLIYNHNLHEKLLGVAISKDYIRYATPYCDLLDDPELEVDIDLAINLNKALNGDPNAARSITDTFLLSGGFIDPSTRNFYRDKMINNPHIFANEIDRMNTAFARGGSNIIKDCLNSPCNLFSQTSDSIGRMAQASSTKNGSNSFSIGDLKNTFTNIIDGVDQTIFNKIPSIFQNAVVDVTQTVSKAKENAQAIFTGKKKLKEVVDIAREVGTLRDNPEKIFRYTPDIKSYVDFNDMGSTILGKIKENLGGCFSSFEHAYRNNPYEDNQSTPQGVTTEQYNGQTYDRSPGGVYAGSPTPRSSLSTNSKPTKPFIDDGSVLISDSIVLGEKMNGRDGYSTFGAAINYKSKTIFLDDYGVTADDQLTLDGVTAFGNIKICPSRFLSRPSLPRLKKALGGEPLEDANAIINKLSQGYFCLATLDSLEKIQPQDSKIFNDGVAPSAMLWRRLLGDAQTESNFKFSSSFYKAVKANQAFIAVRDVFAKELDDLGLEGGTSKWQLIKVVDVNTQKILNVDFTPTAFATVFNQGDTSILETRPVKAYNTTAPGTFGRALADAGWKVVFHSHGYAGDIEVRACIGNLEDIKKRLNVFKQIVTESAQRDINIAAQSGLTTAQRGLN